MPRLLVVTALVLVLASCMTAEASTRAPSSTASTPSPRAAAAARWPAPVPAAFTGATVRFQAGAYQQAPSSESAPDTEDARVAFSAITVGPKA